MPLIKRKTHWEQDNLLQFPNLDEVLKVQNQVQQIAHGLQKIVRNIPKELLGELTSITPQDEFLNATQTAKLLNISPRTLSSYRERGLIAYIQYTQRKIMYRKQDILAFLNKNFKLPKDYCE